MSEGLRFAWCFDHGRLHRFGKDGAWCTARRVWLDGDTDVAALGHKHATYGNARYLHELPDDKQLQIITHPHA